MGVHRSSYFHFWRSFETLKRWFNEFKRGRRSLVNECRPKSVVLSKNIDVVQKVGMQDRHVINCKIEATLRLVYIERVYNLLVNEFTSGRIGVCDTDDDSQTFPLVQ